MPPSARTSSGGRASSVRSVRHDAASAPPLSVNDPIEWRSQQRRELDDGRVRLGRSAVADMQRAWTDAKRERAVGFMRPPCVRQPSDGDADGRVGGRIQRNGAQRPPCTPERTRSGGTRLRPINCGSRVVGPFGPGTDARELVRRKTQIPPRIYTLRRP